MTGIEDWPPSTQQWYMSATWDFGTKARVQAGYSWQNDALEQVPLLTPTERWSTSCYALSQPDRLIARSIRKVSMEAMEENPLFFPESQCWELCFSLWYGYWS